MTALSEQFVRLVKRAYGDINAHPDWAQAAADVFMHTRSVQKLLRAAEAMDRLADLHVERRWSDDSDVRVCQECAQAYPCRTAQAMAGELAVTA